MTRTSPKFNTRQIMKSAWVHYKACFGRMTFKREFFACCLKQAWKDAKRALEPVTDIRVAALQYQLLHVDKLSFQMNHENERRRLNAELAELAA